jgi:plasmid maintenance system antidote protein VapI
MPKRTPIIQDGMSPGECVKQLIKENNWLVEQFAARCCWTIEHARTILRGKERLTFDECEMLAEVLETDVSFWVEYEERFREHEHSRNNRTCKEV